MAITDETWASWLGTKLNDVSPEWQAKLRKWFEFRSINLEFGFAGVYKHPADDSWIPWVTIEQMKLMAADNKRYMGFGEPKFVNGQSIASLWLSDCPQPIIGVAVATECVPTRDGKCCKAEWKHSIWSMTLAVAEARALRNAFPNETFGIKIREEYDWLVFGDRRDALNGHTAVNTAPAEPPAQKAEPEPIKPAPDPQNDSMTPLPRDELKAITAFRTDCISAFRIRAAALDDMLDKMTDSIEPEPEEVPVMPSDDDVPF